LVIVAASLGLRPAMHALAERYRKERIPLRRPLAQFDPASLRSFREMTQAPPQHFSWKDVGTDEFFYGDLEETGTSGRPQWAGLLVTYYSDPEDKVPHTPEVCYRQGGVVVTDVTTTTVETPELGPDCPSIQARTMHLDQGDRIGVLAYVFVANGEFLYDRDQVRWIISRPGDRYVYFSKVEAVADYSRGGDPAPAYERCKRLLSEVLPILVRDYFPRKSDLEQSSNNKHP